MRRRGLVTIGASVVLTCNLAFMPVRTITSIWKLPMTVAKSSQSKALGLTVDDGVLHHNGYPFRGVGVNYFTLFTNLLKDPNSTSYIKGLKLLEQYHIPFVRFPIAQYYSGLQEYTTDPKEYWTLLTGVFHMAAEDHIGLIPDFFWTDFTLPDIYHAPISSLGNPLSKPMIFMNTFVRKFIARFGDSPALWGYEFGNEYNLQANIPMGSGEDLSGTQLHAALEAFAKTIRLYDPARIIESGNATDRLSSYHQQYDHNSTVDTVIQYTQMMNYYNPAPLDMMSVHFYPQTTGSILPPLTSAKQMLKLLNSIADKAAKPLFVGEFGVENVDTVSFRHGQVSIQNSATPQGRHLFRSILEAIVDSGTPLAALWQYDYSDQPNWDVTAFNNRSYQLKDIEQVNLAFQAEGFQHGAE